MYVYVPYSGVHSHRLALVGIDVHRPSAILSYVYMCTYANIADIM